MTELTEIDYDGVRLLARAGSFEIEMAREIFEDRYYTCDGWDIPKGSTVLDIGGNIGAFAVFAAAHGAAEVFTFEPIPESFEILERNVAGWPQIAPHMAAVAVQPGTVRMTGFAPMEDGTLHTGLPTIQDDGTLAVAAVSIHDVLAERPWWDVVKLDIEGYEFDLLGDLDGDEFAKIGMITMEFHSPDEESALERGESLGEFLRAHDFDTVEVDWAWGCQGRLRARR